MRLHSLVSCALLLSVAARLPAQCAPVSGTGCPSAPALSCLTQPRVGMPLQLSSMICLGTTYRLWVLGLPIATPILLAAPITCGSVTCGLGGNPVVLLTLPGSTLQIPNDPTLISGVVVLQESCVTLGNTCLTLAGAA